MGIKDLRAGGRRAAPKEQAEARLEAESELEALRRQLAEKEAAASTPADEHDDEPVVVHDDEAPGEDERAVAIPAGAFSALVDAAAATGGGLDALIAADDSDEGAWSLFPEVAVSGGDLGGQWVARVPEDHACYDELPTGKKAVTCVLLAARMAVTAWKASKDDTGEDADTPAWSFASPLDNIEVLQAAQASTKKVQMTPKDQKSKFDWNGGSGTGRPVPALELLVWLPDAGVVILRTPPVYGSFVKSIRAIRQAICDNAGNIVPGPVVISIQSQSQSSRSRKWFEYHFGFATPRDGGAPLMGAFKDFLAEVDDELDAKVTEWTSAQDRPVSDFHMEKMSAIRQM